jgi:predicted nucleic acid-binding protein
MYLLDTNVVSELRRPKPHGGVRTWVEAVPEQALFLAAITLGELQAGVEITREQDAAKAREIEAWIDKVKRSWNVLPMDGQVFRTWARLMHRQSDSLIEDAMIAATALVFDLTVATQNVRDFESFGIRIHNPFEA